MNTKTSFLSLTWIVSQVMRGREDRSMRFGNTHNNGDRSSKKPQQQLLELSAIDVVCLSRLYPDLFICHCCDWSDAQGVFCFEFGWRVRDSQRRAGRLYKGRLRCHKRGVQTCANESSNILFLSSRQPSRQPRCSSRLAHVRIGGACLSNLTWIVRSLTPRACCKHSICPSLILKVLEDGDFVLSSRKIFSKNTPRCRRVSGQVCRKSFQTDQGARSPQNTIGTSSPQSGIITKSSQYCHKQRNLHRLISPLINRKVLNQWHIFVCFPLISPWLVF